MGMGWPVSSDKWKAHLAQCSLRAGSLELIRRSEPAIEQAKPNATNTVQEQSQVAERSADTVRLFKTSHHGLTTIPAQWCCTTQPTCSRTPLSSPLLRRRQNRERVFLSSGGGCSYTSAMCHPASRASFCLLEKSRQVMADQTSGLVNLVFSRQTGFFDCEHRFNDKPMVITEPAAPSARPLGLDLKLYQQQHTARVRQRYHFSCRVFFEYANNRATETKALLAPGVSFQSYSFSQASKTTNTATPDIGY